MGLFSQASGNFTVWICLSSLAGQHPHTQQVLPPSVLLEGALQNLPVTQICDILFPPESGRFPIIPRGMFQFGVDVSIRWNTPYNIKVNRF